MSVDNLTQSTLLTESDMQDSSPAQLRLSHARYFAEQYLSQNGPPVDSYWLMVGHFDAFLFSLASVYDMAAPTGKAALNASPLFRFFRALRNVTTHHSVLAASIPGNKFLRPFNREIMTAIGYQNDSSRLRLNLAQLRSVLDAVLQERLGETKNIEAARQYVDQLEAQGGKEYLEDLMAQALTETRQAIA